MGKDVVKKGARRWLRPALWTIFGVWAVIIIVLQIALNSKVLTRVVNDVAKEYVDGDVTFTGVKASMFKSFPNLNVTIDNFSITYPHDRFAAFDSLDVPGGHLLKSGRGEGADTLAHFRKFSVSVNYLAAATGRLRIRHAILDHPRIFAHQYDSTTANWNIFGDGSVKEDGDTIASTLPPVSVGKVSLEGRPFIVYTNPSDTIFGCIFLKQLTAKGRYDAKRNKIEGVSLEMDSLFVAGRLPADTVALGVERLGIKERAGHFDVNLSSRLFLGMESSGRMSIPVEIEGDIFPELEKKCVTVGNMTARVATVGLSANGKADFSGKDIHIKGSVATENASINEIAGYFGDNFPILKKLRTDATLTVNAFCDGSYDKSTGSLPPLSVRIQVPDSRIGWEGISGDGRFDLDITATSQDGKLTAEVPDFCFSVNGMKVMMSGTADDLLGADPKFDISSDIHIVLDSLACYLPDSLGVSVHGDLEGIIEGDFRLSQLDAFNFSEIGLEGLLESNGIRISIPKDTLFAYLGHTDISLGAFNHDEDDHDGHGGHGGSGHRHSGLSVAIDSMLTEYGASTFIRGTGLTLSAHNTKERMSADPKRHPIHGHLDIASIGMMDIDSCFVGAIGSVNTFKLSLKQTGTHSVPFISLSSRNKNITLREGVTRFSGQDARLSVEAHPNSAERQLRRKHLLDSLQRIYPGVKRDSLLRKVFGKYASGTTLPDYLSEKDFEKSDIKIQLGESFANYIRDWDITGDIDLAEGLVITPYYPLDNRITGFSGKFSNNTIDLNRLSFKSGVSDISATGHLTGLKRFLVSGKGRLNLDLGITSDEIDMNEILIALNAGKKFTPIGHNAALSGVDDNAYLNTVKEMTAADTTASTSLVVLPSNLNAKISLSANKIRYSNLETSWVASDIVMKERCLQATNTLATTNMGDVYLEGFYSTRTKKDLKAGFDLTLSGITAEKVIELFPAVDSIVPMLKAFRGLLDCEIAATSSIDTSMNIVLPTLSGIVKIDGKNLSLTDSDELNKLRRSLMFKDKDSSFIKSLSIRGIIKENHMEIFPFLLNIDRYSIAASGLQGFDQRFKYHLSALKSPIPFKFGINVNGTFDNWKWKLGKTKYKSRNIPLFDDQVNSLTLNLTSAIHNIFEKGVEQALKQNELSQKAIENKKKELDYSASLTEDLSADEKKTLKVLETVTGAGNIGDNGAGSHLPPAEPAGTNDAAERDGQKNNI